MLPVTIAPHLTRDPASQVLEIDLQWLLARGFAAAPFTDEMASYASFGPFLKSRFPNEAFIVFNEFALEPVFDGVPAIATAVLEPGSERAWKAYDESIVFGEHLIMTSDGQTGFVCSGLGQEDHLIWCAPDRPPLLEGFIDITCGEVLAVVQDWLELHLVTHPKSPITAWDFAQYRGLLLLKRAMRYSKVIPR